MSTTYNSTTFSVPSDQAPGDLSSPEGVQSFFLTFSSNSIELQREIRYPQHIGKASLMLHVRDALISVSPHHDVPGAEDGTGPEYLFDFLRTMLAILQVAAERQETIVHIQVLPS